jgi:hypothetical protein
MPFLRRLHRANKLKLSKSERKGERRKDGHMGWLLGHQGVAWPPHGPKYWGFFKKNLKNKKFN